MKRFLVIISFFFILAASAAAQEIRVTPASVNAYSQGATTVFLTFSNVVNKQPADACWCGDLVSAAPDIGFKCNPATLFGCLPVRYDRSRLSGNSSYTDIMSIPSSVARRAYIDAAGGAEATFFYVRRFVSTSGGPDEFVPVTIRLSGNGAAVPFSLTNVKLSWGVDKPVILVKSDERLPQIKAEITYTGTGRLVGRWEIVKPGDEFPSERDLLTQATLPIEERGLQKRYTQLSRFSVYLPPVGKYILPGPEAWRVPSHLEGPYLVLLRIEAADDSSGNANLPAVGAGPATISTGAVAGFPLPVLRYYVSGSGSKASEKKSLALISPADNSVMPADRPIEFRWAEIEQAALYRVEMDDSEGNLILSAVVLPGSAIYRAPSWLKEKSVNGLVRWRVLALSKEGNTIGETPGRNVRIAGQRLPIK